MKPCSNSIGWINGDNQLSFVTVNGYLLGKTKQLRFKQKYSSQISKCSLFRTFLKLTPDHLTATYSDVKQLSSDYNQKRSEFMLNHPLWIQTEREKYYQFQIEQNDNEK